MGKDKYHDIDELLVDEPSKPVQARKRRLSPALGAMTGEKSPVSFAESLKQQRDEVQRELEKLTAEFADERQTLMEQIKQSIHTKVDAPPIVLTMPVTKQRVSFQLKHLDPALIDVSPENERIQGLLDEVSLRDILPSIKKNGQQKPGTARPMGNGRYELIEGSRRLACVKLAQKQYLCLVGDVPDADVRELSVIENQHKDVSPYEKAKAFEKAIVAGEFESWTQLGAAKGISSSHISRYRQCVQLDEMFVRLLPSPSDMSLSYGETIAGLLKKNRDDLYKKAEELICERLDAANRGLSYYDCDELVKILKSAVRTRTERPSVKRPIVYTSKSLGVSLKHSVSNRGSTKLELMGIDETKARAVVAMVLKALKLEQK